MGSSLLVTRLFQKNRSYFGEEMVLQLTLEIKELEAKIEKIKKEWHFILISSLNSEQYITFEY